MPTDFKKEDFENITGHYVYMIRRPVFTGDFRYYIGVFGPRKIKITRWEEHLKNAERNKKNHLSHCIKKYNDYSMEILYGPIEKEEAYYIERELVPFDPILRAKLGLLNGTGGGKIPPSYDSLSLESKENKSKNMKNAWKEKGIRDKVCGDNHWTHNVPKEELPLYGKKGPEHPCYGLKYSKERLESISGVNSKNYGKRGALCKTSKPVKATNVKTGEIKTFVSAKEACSPIDGWATSHGNVINCCKKRPKYNTHNGCRWEYL